MRTTALVTLAVLVSLSATYAQDQGPTEAAPPAQRDQMPMMQGMMGGMMGGGMMKQMSRMMENCNKMMESHLQQQPQQPPQQR